MKVIWDQLIEAAITYTDFKSKYNRSAFNEKTFFWSAFFTVFFSRLPIYESIAAIFWQSASYVLSFLLFMDWILYLNGFFNPFIVHYRPCILLEPNFSLSPEDFVHMRYFDIDFQFLKNFWSDISGNVFPNSLIVRSISSSCLNNENCLNFTSWDVLLSFFVSSSSDALFRFTFVHTAKLKRIKSLNDFFLLLAAFLRVSSFFMLSLANVLRSFVWLDFHHTRLTSLNKMTFAL